MAAGGLLPGLVIRSGNRHSSLADLQQFDPLLRVGGLDLL